MVVEQGLDQLDPKGTHPLFRCSVGLPLDCRTRRRIRRPNVFAATKWAAFCPSEDREIAERVVAPTSNRLSESINSVAVEKIGAL
jgi:hypothetical protein